MANYDKVVLRGIELDALYKGETKIYPIETSTIYYKTSDGSLMNFTQDREIESPYLYYSNGFADGERKHLKIISNTYTNGQGVLTLEGVVQGIFSLTSPTGALVIPDKFRYKLTEITFPNTVTYIEGYAFCYLTNLKSVTLPENVAQIDPVFYSDSSLTSLWMKSTTAPTITDTGSFQGTSMELKIYYPKGADYSTWITSAKTRCPNWTFVEYETEGGSGGKSEEIESSGEW